jgi:hypothetical protein
MGDAMTVTIESLNVNAEDDADYRRRIAEHYRFQREVAGQEPISAARDVMEFRARVVANSWVAGGEVNRYSGFAYLIACEWYESAQRLTKRRQARRAVAA